MDTLLLLISKATYIVGVQVPVVSLDYQVWRICPLTLKVILISRLQNWLICYLMSK